MPRIPDAEVARLKQSVRLEVLAERRGMTLERGGGAEVKARCCFHQDDTPSLFINTTANLYQCFGCGAKGDVIAWVRELEGLNFPDAVAWLVAFERGEAAPEPQGKRVGRVQLECPISEGSEGSALVAEVARFYHRTLIDDPLATAGEARALLERRRLWYPDLIRRHAVGFDDRSLGTRLPSKQVQAGSRVRSRLEAVGLYRSTGHIHFRGCVTFPIEDQHTGEIISLYGRRAQKAKDDIRHVNLPGPRRGVWNAGGCRAAAGDRDGAVILCEAVMDALSFVAHGQPHATACLGVNGFTDDLRDFLKAHARTVFLAFDRDAPGDRAALEIGEALIGMGLSVHRVQFAAGQDANAAVCTAADPAEMLSGVLRLAPWMGGPPRVSVPALPGRDAAGYAHRVESGGDTSREWIGENSGENSSAAERKDAAVDGGPASAGALIRDAAADASFSAAPVVSVDPAPASGPAPAVGSAAASALPPGMAETGPDELTATFPPRLWRVRGWQANTSYDRLKVAVRVIDHGPSGVAGPATAAGSGLVWGDQVDLASAKQRQAAVAAAAAELGIPGETLKAELSALWLAVESLQDRHLQAQRQAANPAPVDPVAAMTPERNAAAAAFLRRADLLSAIVQHGDACGVVGEAANVEVAYLAAISRKMPDPLAVLIQASSSAGKSSLQDGVFRFIPPEDKLELTDMTGAALRYMAEDALSHKAVAVAEDDGASNAVYSIKIMQSAGGLRIAVPVKNPTTNELETKVREVRGPVAFFQTSTKPTIDEELQNRCLVLTVDESRTQTAAVHQRQRDLETVAGYRARQAAAAIFDLHHDAQRLLAPVRVFNPYAPHLGFTTISPRTRRDHAKYLRLIRTIAFLRQFQRTLHRLPDGTPYIEATLDDIADANRLAAAVLGRGLDELAPQTRRLLTTLGALVDAQARAQGVPPAAVRFTRRQVREHTGLSPTQVHVHLTRLIDLEYVHPHRVGSGGGLVYELAWTGEGQQGERFCLGLIAIPELTRRLAAATALPDGLALSPAAPALALVPPASAAGTAADSSLSAAAAVAAPAEMVSAESVPIPSMADGIRGSEASHSAPIRPAFGPDSVGFRGGENDEIDGESRTIPADDPESAEKALREDDPAERHTVGGTVPLAVASAVPAAVA